MNAGRSPLQERLSELRKVAADPEERIRYAREPELLVDGTVEVLRWLNPGREPDAGGEPPAAAGASNPCDGWFAAEIICLGQALAAADQEVKSEWFDKASFYNLQGRVCEEEAFHMP